MVKSALQPHPPPLPPLLLLHMLLLLPHLHRHWHRHMLLISLLLLLLLLLHWLAAADAATAAHATRLQHGRTESSPRRLPKRPDVAVFAP